MEKEDRDLLIRMDERMQNLSDKTDDHIKESKDFRDKVLTKLDEHSNRLTAIESRNKSGLSRLFAFIATIFTKGSV
jgi:predicted house-cleaning noncanonical NTP pyrophosphatase (MazG superfamily)